MIDEFSGLKKDFNKKFVKQRYVDDLDLGLFWGWVIENFTPRVSQLEPPVIVKLADIETEDYVLKNTTRGSYWLENKEFGEGLEVYHKELNDLLGDYFKKWF